MTVDHPFCRYSAYMAECYGEPLYRVAVDLGFGCPHRSRDGSGGCTFCAEDGGRARQIGRIEDPVVQVRAGLKFARRRYDAARFMLYIQAHTGTFAQPDRLLLEIEQLLDEGPFSALSVGTRPDCLSDKILQVLKHIASRLDVWVEVGVQTSHDGTLNLIKRGHDWHTSRDAIIRLAEAGLRPGPHVILGLPGEGPAAWNQTALRLAQVPIAAVKIHNLHVITGTQLAADYSAIPFPVLDEHGYADAVIGFLRRLPPTVPIMRLTTDTPPEMLIAPKWAMSKGQFVHYLEQQMRYRGVRQGDCYPMKDPASRDNWAPTGLDAAFRIAQPESRDSSSAGIGPAFHPDCGSQSGNDFAPLPTEDGTPTFWSAEFKEHFHSKVGARTEATKKFAEPSGLAQSLGRHDVKLLDICFGLGYNSLVACELAERMQSHRLEITALEIDAQVVGAASRCLPSPADAVIDWGDCLNRLTQTGRWQGRFSCLELIIGDARARLEQAAGRGPFDIVFLDAFSTQRNAELWTLDFLTRIRQLMSGKGVLVTYCAALPVRAALLQAGFNVGETPPIGRKRGGTVAATGDRSTGIALPDEELQAIRTTTRGIPYRDPSQTWTSRQILRHRESEVRRRKTEVKDGQNDRTQND